MSEFFYISPSSQPANVYAVGNTNEQEQCRKIAGVLETELLRCGFGAKAGMSGTMYTRVRESNALNAKVHMPIHTNGFDGTVAGLRIMIGKMGGEAEEIAKAIMEELAPITPGKSDGISVSGAYEIKNTKALCIYVEVGFHDNSEEAQWIIDHTEDIAVAIAKGVCKHFKRPYVPMSEKETPKEKEETVVNAADSVGKISLPDLKKGSAGKTVKALQYMLHAMGYKIGNNNPFDGNFGPMTDAAVRSYQKKNKLTVDGIVGPKTWAVLLGVA